MSPLTKIWILRPLILEVTPVVEEVTGDKNVQPTKVVGTNQVIIKTRSLNLDEREALNKALVDKFGVDESLIQAESISSTVSNEMRRDAVVAVFVATIFMLALHLVPFQRYPFCRQCGTCASSRRACCTYILCDFQNFRRKYFYRLYVDYRWLFYQRYDRYLRPYP